MGDPLPRPEAEEFVWDKASPTAPPGVTKRPTIAVPAEITDYVWELVLNESHVLDLCVDAAMDIIERNVLKRMVGADHFADGGGASPVGFGVAAVPMAVELYRQVGRALNGKKKEEFELVVNGALNKTDH